MSTPTKHKTENKIHDKYESPTAFSTAVLSYSGGLLEESNEQP
jgi:hypothetical protein